MATSTAQRVGIWIIAVAMIVGTVVGFLVMILSTKNNASTQDALAKYQSAYTEYSTKTQKQQTDLTARTDELSNTYKDSFVPQKQKVAKYDGAKVTALSSETIKPGDGKAITNEYTYAAYYIGFNPDGTIFDSSLNGSALKTPLIVRPGGVIAGWAKGMEGKQIGGIYELTIPSDQAYGATGSGDTIKPNTPLKFIVMPVELLTTYKEPQVTKEVMEAYGSAN